MLTPREMTKQAWLWLAAVASTGVLLRLALFLTYPPVSYNDTPSYRRLAGMVLDGFRGYDGTRTPGYPVFLALAGTDRTVYALQLLMGLLVSLMLFAIAWQAGGSAAFSGLVGLAHTFNLGQLFFEANLLTETLTTLLVVAALLALFRWMRRPERGRLWLAALAGLLAGMAALVRPLFIFLPVWLALFAAVSLRERRVRVNWSALAAGLLPGLLLIGVWMGYIRANFGNTGVTTMNGYHLMQHTGYYFEDVPDEHAVLRDIYLRYRAERITNYGTQGNTIWDAIPEMERATGYSFYQLSDVLAKISVRLIVTHPGQYLYYAAQGWWMFWRAPFYWEAGAVAAPGLRAALQTLVIVERGLLVAANLVFVVSTVMALVWRKARAWMRPPAILVAMASTVWVASIIQTLLDHGDNPRFLVPLQTLVVVWVLWILVGRSQVGKLEAILDDPE